MSAIDEEPQPVGTLTLQTLAMPRDTNPQADVFAGWLMSQMDLAGAIMAQSIARGRVTTVAVGSMVFLRPVPVGSTVSCYAETTDVGRSSITTMVEVWLTRVDTGEQVKVTEGEFVFVAIDDRGHTRALPNS